jgi:putative oxidoreductase
VKLTSENGARVVIFTVLRVIAGLLFAQHGAQKLFGALGGHQVGSLLSLTGLAGVLELVGGLLVAFGLFTRPVAFILSGEMAVAYFMQHAPQGFWPIMNKGESWPRSTAFCFSTSRHTEAGHTASTGCGAVPLDG